MNFCRGVDKITWATRSPVPWPVGWNICPRGLGSLSECRRCRPAVPRELGLFQWACGVDQLSWAIQALVRGTARSTSCPR